MNLASGIGDHADLPWQHMSQSLVAFFASPGNRPASPMMAIGVGDAEMEGDDSPVAWVAGGTACLG